MTEQSISVNQAIPHERPHLPSGLALFVILLILTQIFALMMNQPPAYWLDSSYVSTNLALSFLLKGGPWLFLGFVVLYVVVVGLLLRKLPPRAALPLAFGLSLVHSLALYRNVRCGFYPIYEAHTADACYAYRYVPLILFQAIFGLILLMERLPDRFVVWGKRLSIALGLLWVVLMGYGVFRAAVPPVSPWRPIAPAHFPGPRSMTAVAYDSRRQRTVLFGGYSVWNGNEWVYDNSTWEWDGEDWQKMETRVAPPGRTRPAMAYDEKRGKVMLYGGENASGALSDLWEWDGAVWRQLCPVCNPAARYGHKMVYDIGRQQIVVYGGWNDEIGYAEAWTWDGTAWSLLPFESSTPAVYNAPLVYEESRARIVSFTGGEWGGTWVWEASTWRKLEMAGGPPVRDESVLVYDPLQQHTVLFGGVSTDQEIFFADTWILDGESWTKLDIPRAPSQRRRAVAFYDPSRHSIILYGGEILGSVYSDMWELVLPGGTEQ